MSAFYFNPRQAIDFGFARVKLFASAVTLIVTGILFQATAMTAGSMDFRWARLNLKRDLQMCSVSTLNDPCHLQVEYENRCISRAEKFERDLAPPQAQMTKFAPVCPLLNLNKRQNKS